jgi:hypothetical protein
MDHLFMHDCEPTGDFKRPHGFSPRRFQMGNGGKESSKGAIRSGEGWQSQKVVGFVRKIKTNGEKQPENGSVRFATKHHKYFTDVSDVQMTATGSIDFEALSIKFRLTETPE